MEDAEQLESKLTKQLQAISTNLHLSLRQHSRYTHEDAAMALLENARLSVQYQKQALGELEIARAEVARVGTEGSQIAAQAQAQAPVRAVGRGTAQAYERVQGDSMGQGGDGPLRAQRYDAQTPPPPAGRLPQHMPQQQQRPQQMPAGTQSMFLPPPSGDTRYPQFDPRQPVNGSGSASGQHPPLPQQTQQARPQHPQQQSHRPEHPAGQGTLGQPPTHTQGSGHGQSLSQGQRGMAQSMVMPPSHAGNGQRPATVGRQGGRRLDERQAARMLAGGF